MQGFTFKWVLRELNRKMADNPTQSLYTVINRVGKKNIYGTYKQYGYGYAEYFDTPEKRKNGGNNIRQAANHFLNNLVSNYDEEKERVVNK